MRGFFGLACLLAGLTVLGTTGSARADRYDRYDRDVDSVRLYGGIGLGFGGDLELPNPPGGELDLGTSIGGQFGIDFVLLRYFALGAEARISGYDIEGWSGRSRFIDIVAKPRLRLPLSGRSEIYATVPIGVTIPRLAEDDVDEKAGWNIGIGGGYTHFFTSNFGVNLEPIYIIHNFDNDVTAKQFHLLLNAVFAI